jgi:hypothetical protein
MATDAHRRSHPPFSIDTPPVGAEATDALAFLNPKRWRTKRDPRGGEDIKRNWNGGEVSAKKGIRHTWNPPRLLREAKGCILDSERWRIVVTNLWMVYGARALALLWAGFWIFFFVGSVMVEPTYPRVIVVGSLVLLLFVILALVPWRWEAAGGLLLVVTSLLIGATYAIASASIVRDDGSRLPLAVRAIGTLFFGGPPLVAGILFLLHRHRAANTRAGAG